MYSVSDLKYIHCASTGITVALGYLLWRCFHNLYLHPLSRFPGPKVAAIGGLYEFWWEVICDGRYLWEIERMHEQYGPIVRINANELHIRDPEFYSTIYAGSGRRINKDTAFANAFGLPTSVVTTVDHHHHRARRSYLSPYFSKRAITDMEPMIHERILRLCERLERARRQGEVVPLDSAFSAMSADIITQRVYGEHFNFLDIPDFRIPVTEAFLGISLVFHFVRFMPWVVTFFKRMPIAIIAKLSPSIAKLLLMQQEGKTRILRSLASHTESSRSSDAVLVSALADPSIPSAERDLDRLLDEGVALIMGGTESTARTLSIGMFYLLSNKNHLGKLREELSTLPFRPDFDYAVAELERLPFLTGVVQESLRFFSPGTRSPRVSVDEPIQYRNFSIPPGTPVSLSGHFIHNDPTIFPEPHSFDPDRWIRAAAAGNPLNKFLVTFSKGSRQCLGIPMAMAELYMTFARLISTFDMELYQTTADAVQVHHVRLVNYPDKRMNTGNVRGEIYVKITGRGS